MASLLRSAVATAVKRPPSVDEVMGMAPRDAALPLAHYQKFWSWLSSQSPDAMDRARTEADLFFRRVGITFNVYGDEQGTERLIPFDLIPRILPSHEWQMLDRGLRQRVTALNRFIHDIYHHQEILRANVIPRELVLPWQFASRNARLAAQLDPMMRDAMSPDLDRAELPLVRTRMMSSPAVAAEMAGLPDTADDQSELIEELTAQLRRMERLVERLMRADGPAEVGPGLEELRDAVVRATRLAETRTGAGVRRAPRPRR